MRLRHVLRRASGPGGCFAQPLTHAPKVAPTAQLLVRSATTAAATKSRKSSLDSPTLVAEGRSRRALDGNSAAAHVAYAMSDVSFIYPISPSTSMGESVDKFASSGRENIFGQQVKVRQMQSELGSAGALHGALSAGGLCTTFTASQGLLLMIPNMYLCAGELLPAVFHVSARALARQSLSIFCDHSDVMAVRPTGCALLSSHNAQEVMDLGVVAHMAAIKASVPMVHFFDGTRTSGVVASCDPIPYSDMAKVFPWEELDKFRQRGLNPQHPISRGLGQDPQVYYQSAVSANPFYQAVPGIVQDCMDELAMVTGRQYKLFEYYGHPEAERAVVIMGSASKTTEETVDYLNNAGEKVGVLKVHLFRPFSTEHFLAACPPSIKSVAVLDRTKEDLAPSLPLHADVLSASATNGGVFQTIVGGSYGLGSKEFSPRHVKAVFDNLKLENPKNHFNVGIKDDVTHSSLDYGPAINCLHPETTQAIFFGLGSDGTVGANKQAAAIIGERTPMYSQGHFNYSSQKAGASTVSHLRFGPAPIKSEYEIEDTPGADYVACHHTSFLPKFDMLSKARPGANFVVNCPWTSIEDLDINFPARLRRDIADKKVTLYTIDAHAAAVAVGLPAKRINQVLQATFFKLSNVLPHEEALEQLNASVDRLYGAKDPKIVSSNKAALIEAPKYLNKIDYPESWISAEDTEASLAAQNPSRTKYSKPLDEFSTTFLKNIDSRSGDGLPVSAFSPGGETPIGQSEFQKRALAEEVPEWIPDSCTQCNLCSIVCPHAVIRPFLLNKNEKAEAPEGYQSRKAKGEVAGNDYTIQIAPFDCTGCAVCVEMCPDDSLVMKPQEDAMKLNEHWEFSLNHTSVKDKLMERNSVKGSQFQEPLMEFSGACSGCGETPYVKLLTQLFGERMIIANSSGCSSVWGGSYGLSPFRKNIHGQGPAWARSLFEDTAEYGLGMAIATQQRRENLTQAVDAFLQEETQEDASPELIAALEKWRTPAVHENADKCNALYQSTLLPLLQKIENNLMAGSNLEKIANGKDMFVPPSQWIIGGDGWAYDIGFGGLDHVLGSGQNVNILVLDTEGYSNTGAQISKATPMGAVMKMASGGNPSRKKDLGAMAMMHEGAYVASVSMAADVNQTVKAFKEAEAYNGPSIIIAYATCVDWGHRAGDKAMVQQMQDVVDSGYWPLYRYNPDNVSDANNGFELDNKRISDKAMERMMSNENRFTTLQRSQPKFAQVLQTAMTDTAHNRHEKRRRLAMDDEDLLEHLKKQLGEEVTGERVTVLFGSDTGTSELVAKDFHFEMKRRGMKAKVMSFNDISPVELQDHKTVLAIVATAGQGEMPKSAKKFWEEMETFRETADKDFLKDTKFAVFGMGDSSYVFFNSAAKDFDECFASLGGQRIQELGLGDDQDAERYDTQLEEWAPNFYDTIQAPEPPQELGAPTHKVEIKTGVTAPEYVPAGSAPAWMTLKRSTVPAGYERAIDHFEFKLSDSIASYDQGDSLGLWPSNDKEQADLFLSALGLTGDEAVEITNVDSNRPVPLPEVVSARVLATEILDVQGWPKRKFYEMLKLSATDDAEKQALTEICSRDGKAAYREHVDESYTYAELLHKYPSAKPSLATLLDYIPDLKPRLYSIASSSRFHSNEECHLCIIKNEWTATSGRNRVGLATNWLADAFPEGGQETRVHACIHPSAVALPDTHKTPMLMVALGTGIAPMRAFIEERAAAKRAGEECAPMALFFGARNRQEYSYEEEFDAYQKEGVLEHIHLALSREQKEKIYVTHRLAQQAQLIYDLIHEQNGNLYLCGPGGNVPPQVRQAVVNAIKANGHSEEYAEKYVLDMQIGGRYNVEAW